MDCPTDSVRPYLCVEVESWRGQLVVTTFVRVVVLTGILFVETAVYVLPPLRDEYLAVDELRIRTRSERIRRTVTEATVTCLPALLASWVRLSSAVAARRRAAAREREFRRELSDDVWIDYGATTSLREAASGDRFDGYPLQQDAGMAVLVVKQRVADAVAQFLADHGYRTDKINLIQNNINNGIQVNAPGSNIAGIGPGANGNGVRQLARRKRSRRIAMNGDDQRRQSPATTGDITVNSPGGNVSGVGHGPAG